MPGDLTRPALGLSTPDWERLADSIGSVYHNGAQVHLLHPYTVLRRPNVTGTVEVLRLACTGAPKRFHHVSTLDVFPDRDRTRVESMEPDGADGISGAYAQSKWVAEKLVRTARERGLPTSIYRPGNVAGHTRTGYWNETDALLTLLRGCIRLGAAPDLDLRVNLTPLDYASRALVRLSGRPEDGVYHLFNPHPPLPWSEVVDSLREFGWRLDLIGYGAWRERVLRPAGGDGVSSLYGILALLPEQHGGHSPLHIDCARTLAGLAGTGISCPATDTALLHTYCRHWVRRGLVPAPVGATR